MEKLNLPVIKGPLPPPKVFSMDDYFDFIQMFHAYCFNAETYEFWKQERRVNIPFILK